MPTVAKACRYYRLVDATRGRTGGRTVEVTVWLKTEPTTPRRVWFPISGMHNKGPDKDGNDQLYAADWLIRRENIKLIAGLHINPMDSFLK